MRPAPGKLDHVIAASLGARFGKARIGAISIDLKNTVERGEMTCHALAASAVLEAIGHHRRAGSASSGADGTDTAAAGMSGAGDAAETFVIDPSALVAGDHMAEILTGYNTGKGDVVDLTELLGNKVSADHIGDFVRTVEGGDGAADQLQVSATGHVSDFVTVAVLDANAGVKVLYNDDQHHQQNATV